MELSLKDRIRLFLQSRQASYRRVFSPEIPGSQEVLKDLAKFCRANQSTFLPDARGHAVLEGRREVWLRIQQHLNLSEEELWRLTSGE